MIANLINITTRSSENIYFQQDQDTIEKRSGRWLKELASKSQATGFDLNAWIPATRPPLTPAAPWALPKLSQYARLLHKAQDPS